MANQPSKRRGISLDPRVDSVVSPDLLSRQPAPSPSHEHRSDKSRVSAETTGGDGTSIAELIAALRRANADLRQRSRRQSDQLQRQLELLEQQRDQINLQTHQLRALERARKASGRTAALLVLLAIVAAGAVVFRQWPEVRSLDDLWARIGPSAPQLTPELRAMRDELATLSGDLDQMGGAIASLRADVSGVRTDLGEMRKEIASSSGTQTAGTTGSGNAVPRNATTMSTPYRGLRPRMPW